MYNAFYYEDKYYLIPNEFSDYQGFMEAVYGKLEIQKKGAKSA